MKKKFKIAIGATAFLAAAFFNFRHANEGYGFSNGGLLPQVLAQATETIEDCGTDRYGQLLPCKKRPKESHSVIQCDHYSKIFYEPNYRYIYRNGIVVDSVYEGDKILLEVHSSASDAWIISPYHDKPWVRERQSYVLEAFSATITNCETDAANENCIPGANVNCSELILQKYGPNAS